MRVDNSPALRLSLAAILLSLLAACASPTPKPTDLEPVSGPTTESVRTDTAETTLAVAEPEAQTDLWQRIRSGFRMAELDSPRVERQIKWYASHPDYIQRMVERASLYLYFIVEEVERRKMPMEIALLPAIESSYKPHAYSRARAAGLWQFIPSTGRVYGLHNDWWYDGRRDVVAATNAALDYLQALSDSFDGDWHLALASYNAGERRVRGAQAYNRKRGRDDSYQHLTTLRPETRNYVPKLIAFSRIVAEPEAYGITLEPIANEPYFAEIETGSQIDLGVAARKAGIPIGDLYDINPAFKRWATSPDGPHRLLVPAHKAQDMRAALANLPQNERIQWRRHYVRQGDALSTIARRYGVSVRSIKAANRLRSSRIRAGTSLLIPVSTRKFSRHYANVTKPIQRKPVRPPAGTVARIHEVQPGDTLWSISQQHGVYMRQLARWNAIGTRSILRPGQKLKIWVKPETKQTEEPGSQPVSGKAPASHNNTTNPA